MAEINDNGIKSDVLPNRTKLVIDEARLEIYSPKKMPNRWRRFWYWALLGWRWEKIDE